MIRLGFGLLESLSVCLICAVGVGFTGGLDLGLIDMRFRICFI